MGHHPSRSRRLLSRGVGKSALAGVLSMYDGHTRLGGWLVEDRVTPELLGRLLDEHGGTLALYAAQWTDSADDCVQEALIELAGVHELPANPVAWLYRVVRNRAVSQYRTSRRRERREELASRLRLREGEIPAEPL